MTLPDDYLRHLIAALWFAFCWVGYTRYAVWKGRDTPCLASVMHLYREDWMRRMLQRDNRIADASVIANLERNASFFASEIASQASAHAHRFLCSAQVAGDAHRTRGHVLHFPLPIRGLPLGHLRSLATVLHRWLLLRRCSWRHSHSHAHAVLAHLLAVLAHLTPHLALAPAT